jgi:spermidine synthase
MRSPAGTAYMDEAAGFLAGGLALTFVMLSSMSHAALLLGTAALSLACAILIADARWLKALAAVLLAATALAGSQADRLEMATQAWLYPGYRIQEVRSSPYGQTVVAIRDGQTSFLFNGWPLASLPDPDIAGSEEFVGWGLLFSERPRQALIIGGCWALPALLEHGIDSATYAELDPALIASMRKYWPAGRGRVLDDIRLTVVTGDARAFLERQGRSYDAVFIGLPYPASLGLNRYYTAEFLTTVRARLNPGGTLVLALPGSEAAMDRPKTRLNATVHRTLRTVFPETRIVPGEINFYIAVNGPAVPTDITDRFRQRHYGSPALSEASIQYRLDPKRERQLVGQLEGLGLLGINRDLEPSAVLAGLDYWQSIASPGWAKAYAGAVRLSGLLWLVVLAGLLLPEIGRTGTAFTAGASSMGLQILCLWGLQVRNGAVYHWAGLLSAMFMAGTAAGSWLALRRTATAVRPATILRLEGAAIALLALWAMLNAALDIPGWLCILAAGLNGLLLGIEFPCLVSAMDRGQETKARQPAGRLYAADMAGGFAAALCLGLVAVPAWGIVKAALLLAAVKLVSAKWWAFNFRRIGA